MDFSHLNVEFFSDAVLDNRATEEEGRPIYKDVEKVKIRVAGDSKNILVALANEQSSYVDPETKKRLSYAQLHSAPYEAFKRKECYKGSGTPLSELPWLTEGKRKELISLNIYTAEALAGLDGTALSKIGMGGRDIKEKAKKWLFDASEQKDKNQLSDEIAALKMQVEQLTKDRNTQPLQDAPQLGEAAASKSPFDGWNAEDIRVWIEDNGGASPPPNCKYETLVAKANALNDKLAEQAK